MFGFMPGLADLLTRQVETPEEARAAIADLDRRRVDLVKLVLEPGFPGRQLPKLKDEVFLAAMAEAKSRRMRTTVHVGTDADARLAIEAGANGLEHTARGLSDETIAMMAAKKVTFTPTLVVLDWAWKRGAIRGEDADVRRLAMPAIMQSLLDPSSPLAPMVSRRTDGRPPWKARSRDRSQQVRRAIKAGVPVLAGSDGGNPATFHGISLVRELELLGQAGMPLDRRVAGRDLACRQPPRSIQPRPHLRRRGGGSRAARGRSDRRRTRVSPRGVGVSRRPQIGSGTLMTTSLGSWRAGVR